MDNLFTEVKEKDFYTIYNIKFNVKGEQYYRIVIKDTEINNTVFLIADPALAI